MKNSLDIIQKTIEDYNMFTKNDKILVAFSGGYDSVCLALSLCSLGYNISLAHVNHNLRKTAKNDAEFCEKFAKDRNIPFYYCDKDVLSYANEHKISEETAGRLLRYEFFESLKFDKIATAHHKNDCAETVLQHLVRGSGLKGLTGILPVRDNIVRPLLRLTRSEIEDFVNSYGILPCVDETNFSESYSRNRYRMNIIPLLEKENEQAVSNICKTAELLNEDEKYLSGLALKYVKNNKISVDDLKKLPFSLSSRALREAFKNAAGTAKDFELKHINYILKNLKNHGEILNLPFNITAFCEYGTLIFQKKEEKNFGFCYPLKLGKNEFKNITVTLSLSKTKKENAIYLDADKLCGKTLYLRSPKENDYFRPFGNTGGKSLSKTLIDLKVPQSKRADFPLITTDDEIVFIINKKRSNSFICDKNTKNYLIIQVEMIYE